MGNEDIIDVNYEVIETKEYNEVETFFIDLPEILNPLIADTKDTFSIIEKQLYMSPSLIKVIKSIVPEELLIAVLSDSQKEQIAEGALKLLTKKDGSLMAKLIDPKTKKIVSTIDLKKVSFSPEGLKAMTDFSSQMQMAQIAEEVKRLQIAVEKVDKSLESDRLALAYSLQEKFKLAYTIKNPELRSHALLRVALDAEDARNTLMLSQKNNISFIMSQSTSVIKRLIKGTKTSENDNTMIKLRNSMCAVNVASVVEALSYQALGETETAVNSLRYYADYMKISYGNKNVLKTLDELDPQDVNYWSKMLPKIQNKILTLPKSDFKAIINKEDKNEIKRTEHSY